MEVMPRYLNFSLDKKNFVDQSYHSQVTTSIRMFKFSYKAHYYINILCGLAILIRVILVYYDT